MRDQLMGFFVRTKADYYRLLQQVRERDAWEDWVPYILAAVERTAGDTSASAFRIAGVSNRIDEGRSRVGMVVTRS